MLLFICLLAADFTVILVITIYLLDTDVTATIRLHRSVRKFSVNKLLPDILTNLEEQTLGKEYER